MIGSSYVASTQFDSTYESFLPNHQFYGSFQTPPLFLFYTDTSLISIEIGRAFFLFARLTMNMVYPHAHDKS